MWLCSISFLRRERPHQASWRLLKKLPPSPLRAVARVSAYYFSSRMPYCKIFIWFLLLFLIYFCALDFLPYYLCNNSVDCESNAPVSRPNARFFPPFSCRFLPFFSLSLAGNWLQATSTASTSVCMVLRVNSSQYEIKLASVFGRRAVGVELCCVCDCDLSWCIIKLIIGFWIWNYEALCCHSFAVLNAIRCLAVALLLHIPLWIR